MLFVRSMCNPQQVALSGCVRKAIKINRPQKGKECTHNLFRTDFDHVA